MTAGQMWRPAWLHMDGWAGRSRQRVFVVGETPKRFRIRAGGLVKLAGRGRWLKQGDEALVPRDAVTLDLETRR